MPTSMRSIRSELEYSRFPLRVGLPPSPPWRRRRPTPGPGSGRADRQLRVVRLVEAPSLEEESSGR